MCVACCVALQCTRFNHSDRAFYAYFIMLFIRMESSAVFVNQIRNTHKKGVFWRIPIYFFQEETIQYFYFYFFPNRLNWLDFHVGLFGWVAVSLNKCTNWRRQQNGSAGRHGSDRSGLSCANCFTTRCSCVFRHSLLKVCRCHGLWC